MKTTKGKRLKSAAERKEDVIRLRVTEAQKRTIDDAAARTGLDTSAWLRMLALRAAQGELVAAL